MSGPLCPYIGDCFTGLDPLAVFATLVTLIIVTGAVFAGSMYLLDKVSNRKPEAKE